MNPESSNIFSISSNLESTTEIRPNCLNWHGGRPCSVQVSTAQSSCFGCNDFSPKNSDIYIRANSAYDPDALKTAKKVGIIKMGGLGNILRVSAITKIIRIQNPLVKIDWFTHENGMDLLRYVPGVQPRNIHDTTAVASLAQEVDVLLNLECHPEAKEWVRHAKLVGGFALNKAGNFQPASAHAFELQRFQIDDAFRKGNKIKTTFLYAKALGLQLDEKPPFYDLHIPAANKDNVVILLEKLFEGAYTQYIGINIGTSEKGKLKRWPVKRFVELCILLGNSYPNHGLLILSGPEDAAPREEVEQTFLKYKPSNLRMLGGDLDVGDFIALIDKLNVVVTADTLALHVAATLNTPIVGLVGPMPHRELEVRESDILVGPKLECAPCYYHCKRKIRGECMEAISANEVLEKVERILGAD